MKKLLFFSLTVFTLIGLSVAAMPVVSYATQSQQELIDDAACQEGDNAQCVSNCIDPASPNAPPTQPEECNSTICDPTLPDSDQVNCVCTDTNCNIVNKYLNPFIEVLTILTGIAVVIGIMYGGIQYASSGGDPQKTATARRHIRNSIVALLLFFFLYAFLRFMIPGEGSLIG